jgi:hypothetical protein
VKLRKKIIVSEVSKEGESVKVESESEKYITTLRMKM